MSATNCEETPRQRMIGMMYLVLTAMLALNVSSDVLNAFTKVQTGLSHTVANFEKKNKQVYSEFENAYILNEEKVKPWRDKAISVRDMADKLYNFIEELKWEVVKKADGDDANVNDVLSKDNLDVAGEVMITFGKGKVLKGKINDFRKHLLNLICDKNPVLCNTIEVNLNTKNPPIKDGEIQTWESSNFEHLPLVAVVTIMTKLQTDVRNAESDVITHLYSNIDEGSYKFNSLSAHIIPSTNYLFKGDVYKAKIILAATDTTQRPVVTIDGKELSLYEGDAAVYKKTCNAVGVYKWKGIIKYLTPSGETKQFKVEDEYIVAEPSVVVSPLKMNVFYLGVNNPVSISVSGIDSKKIKVKITNGKIKKDGSIYIVNPQKANKMCNISVGISDCRGTFRVLQILKFRVKSVPDPIASVVGIKGGNISKSKLLSAKGVDAILENFDFNMKFRVTGFNVFTVVDGYVRDCRSKNGRFNNDQRKLFKSLTRNQRIGIEDIRAVGPDGKERKLPALGFKVR